MGATPTVPARSDEERAWDTLTTALNRWGVVHVAPDRPRKRGVPRTARALFEQLGRASDPRLQQAAIYLLLTQPQLAAEAQAAVAELEREQRDRAMRRYAAAVCLQRMARTRLQLRLGPQPLLPPAFFDELGLPAPDEEFGRAALLELAAQEEARYGYDAWATYRTVLDSFLNEMQRRAWGLRCEPELTRPA